MRLFNVPYRLALFSGLVPVLLGLVGWIWIVHLPLLERLEREGIETEAVIVEIGPIRDRVRATKGGGSREITYRFQARDGRWIEGSISENAYTRSPSSEGDRLGVTYLPDRPDIHDTAQGGRYAGRGMILPLLIMIAVLVALAANEWRRLPRPWRGPRAWPAISFD